LGAVLPCYWIYAEVGKVLLQKRSPHSLFQRWIDTYAGDEYVAIVEAVLEITNRIAQKETETTRETMARHFATSTRYEWMFWDMGFRQEKWPV
jgi:thiaminase/transcriptional activator TenA